MENVAKCPHCESIIVCWNWWGPGVEFEEEWVHECWVCNNIHSTKYEVLDGVPYEVLKILYKQHEAGEKVSYTEAMKVLYARS